MKTMKNGQVAYPILYQVFGSAEEIGRVINRSRSYVFKAMKVGFTEREWELLNDAIVIRHPGPVVKERKNTKWTE